MLPWSWNLLAERLAGSNQPPVPSAVVPGLPRWLKIMLPMLLIPLLLVYGLMQLPLRWFLPEDQLAVTYLDRVTLAQGKVWLSWQAPGIAELNLVQWRWCPGSGLLSWCLRLDNSLGGLKALVSFSNGAYTARNVTGEFSLIPALLPLPVAIAGRVELALDLVQFSDLRCPFNAGATVDGELRFNNLELLQQPLGKHRARVSTADEGISMVIDGDSATGAVTISASGGFDSLLLLTPPAALDSLAASFARPRGDGSFESHTAGQLPCLAGGTI